MELQNNRLVRGLIWGKSLSEAKTPHHVLMWLEDRVQDINPAFNEAVLKAYELGQQFRALPVIKVGDGVMAKVAEAPYRALPVITVGDVATAKVTEKLYLDQNWKPLTGSQYLINDAGQLRAERRSKPRGQEIV